MQCKSAGCILLETTAYRACRLPTFSTVISLKWPSVCSGEPLWTMASARTGLMQGNVRYMKFLYVWFARCKDSRLKQITCAKFQKAIILPLGWLSSWVVRSGFKWLRLVQVSIFVSLDKTGIWLDMSEWEVVQVFMIGHAVNMFQGPNKLPPKIRWVTSPR